MFNYMHGEVRRLRRHTKMRTKLDTHKVMTLTSTQNLIKTIDL